MNSSNLTYQSLAQILPTLPPNGLFILFGSTATIFSLLSLYVIIKATRLRTKFFYLLSSSVMCDLILGISYVIVASRRFYRYYSGQGEVVTVWQCFGEICVNTFTQIFSLSAALTLVLDRLTATWYPVKYKQMSYQRLTLPFVFLAVIYASGQITVHFTDAWSRRSQVILVCSIQTATTKSLLDNLATFQLCTSGLVVILNMILAFCIKLRLGAKNKNKAPAPILKNAGQNSKIKSHSITKIAAADMDMKIFKTITVMTLTHATAHLGGRLCQFLVNLYFGESVQNVVLRYTRSLVVLNSSMHFFLLILTSGDFRSAVYKHIWLRHHSGTVGAITATVVGVRGAPAGKSVDGNGNGNGNGNDNNYNRRIATNLR